MRFCVEAVYNAKNEDNLKYEDNLNYEDDLK